MKNNKLIITLKNLGLTDNEAKVYLSALSLGPTSILALSRAAEMNRTTIYGIIDSLKQKGLINIEIKGFKKRYAAEHPEKLEHIIETKKEQLHDVLPEFAALYNVQGQGSTIKYYEGLEAMKSVYDQILKDLRPKEYYYAISDTKKWQALDREYFDAFMKHRSKLPIDIRLLLQDAPLARERKKFERNVNEHIKILPQKTSLITNLVIIPHYIIIHQLTPPITITQIKSPHAVQMGTQLFNIIWNSIP